MKPFEVIKVGSLEVQCDGVGHYGNRGLGHPRVYLHIDQDQGDITCPYCSRQYVLTVPGGMRAGGH